MIGIDSFKSVVFGSHSGPYPVRFQASEVLSGDYKVRVEYAEGILALDAKTVLGKPIFAKTDLEKKHPLKILPALLLLLEEALIDDEGKPVVALSAKKMGIRFGTNVQSLEDFRELNLRWIKPLQRIIEKLPDGDPRRVIVQEFKDLLTQIVPHANSLYFEGNIYSLKNPLRQLGEMTDPQRGRKKHRGGQRSGGGTKYWGKKK